MNNFFKRDKVCTDGGVYTNTSRNRFPSYSRNESLAREALRLYYMRNTSSVWKIIVLHLFFITFAVRHHRHIPDYDVQ